MPVGRTLALGVLVWGAMGIRTQADPLTWSNGSWIWSSSDGMGSASAPSSSLYLGASPSNGSPPAPITTAAESLAPPSAGQAPQASTAPAPEAFINFGNGAYTESGTLTNGTIQPWYDSPSAVQAFGGTPTAQQQSDFANAVLKDIAQTYQLSGMAVDLTLDPNAHAAHTLSVVSGATYNANPDAIGITAVGGSGFSFIDKLSHADDKDQLAWAVAHNIAHELMHAFGVAVHHDQSGQYLDAATASWSLLTNPQTTFSPEATQDILAHLAQDHSNQALQSGAEMLGLSPMPHQPGCQCLLCRAGYQLLPPSPVPEPATVILWGLGASVAVVLPNLRRGVDDESGDSRTVR